MLIARTARAIMVVDAGSRSGDGRRSTGRWPWTPGRASYEAAMKHGVGQARGPEAGPGLRPIMGFMSTGHEDGLAVAVATSWVSEESDPGTLLIGVSIV